MRLSAIAAFIFGLVALPVMAQDLTTGSFLGRDIDEVRFSLKQMGYEVLEVSANDKDISDAPIKASVSKDGKSGQIYVSADSGMPTKIEMK